MSTFAKAYTDDIPPLQEGTHVVRIIYDVRRGSRAEAKGMELQELLKKGRIVGYLIVGFKKFHKTCFLQSCEHKSRWFPMISRHPVLAPWWSGMSDGTSTALTLTLMPREIF